MDTLGSKKKTAWSRGDKVLIIGIGLVVAIVVAITLWYKTINAMPTVSISAPTMPVRNACDDFIAAGNALVDEAKIGEAIRTRSSDYYTPGDYIDTPAEKRAVLQENETALKTLRTGFAHPYQDPTRSLLDSFPYGKFHELDALLILEGQVKASHGDWNGAVSSSLDAMQMGAMIPHGSPTLGALSGILYQAGGRSCLWDDMQHLSAAQSEDATHRMEQINTLHVPLTNVLQQEKREGETALLKMIQEPGWRSKDKSLFVAGSIDKSGIQQQMQLYFISNRSIMDDYHQYMDKSISISRQPYTRYSQIPLPNDSVSQMLVPNFDLVRFRDAFSASENALLTVSLSLHAYHCDHGTYPATLSALIPKYLAHSPNDPFAVSGPLHYKTAGTDYTLYSIGPDGVDDGGRPVHNATSPAPSHGEHDQRYDITPKSKGDIVAGINQSWGIISSS